MTNKSEKDKESIPPRTRRIRLDWESPVEKSIKEAMERGDFDNLPGAGKPLNLRRDPNVPPEWELAFKMLKDAGYAPEWIERDQHLRAEIQKLYAPLTRYLERLAEPAPPRRTTGTRDLSQAERASKRRAREARLIAEFRRHAAELNQQIDLFNLKAPSPRVHRPRIRIEAEIEKFLAASGKE